MSLDTLSLEQRVGQLFFIGIPGPELDAATRALLDEVSPGGVCLFARNIREARQTRELLDGLRELLCPTPFLSVDQEGGLVDRLRRIMTPMPAADRLRNDRDAARLGRLVGETLRLLGFNMDFAPVVDVIDERRSKFSNGLFSRTFGKDKGDVFTFAGAFVKQLEDSGIVGCLKHFPGLGASQVDSHEALPLVDIDEAQLRDTDLSPYRELLAKLDVNAVMVAHAAFPRTKLQEKDQSGKLLPSSLSSDFVTGLLRGELGFDGLVITDDLEMGAIVNNYGIGDACKMAFKAGVDMVAICAEPDAIREGHRTVLSAVKSGEITEPRLEESLKRIARMEKQLSQPAIFDASRLADLSKEIAAFNTELGN